MSGWISPDQDVVIRRHNSASQTSEGSEPDEIRFTFNTTTTCPLCSSELEREHYIIGTYPEPPLESPIPEIEATHSPICRICGERVLDLLKKLDTFPESQLSDRVPIYQSYIEAVDNCCFCNDSLDRPVLGIEVFFKATHQIAQPSLHTICSHCADVFQKFLSQTAQPEGNS